MNLQQLDHSGKQLWTFIVTAVVVLLITAISWFSVEQVDSYRAWRAKIPSGDETPYERKVLSNQPNYSIGARLGILIWLVWPGYGHWKWGSRTVLWWLIVTNSPKTMRDYSRKRDRDAIPEELQAMTVIEHISEAIRTEGPYFRLTDLG